MTQNRQAAMDIATFRFGVIADFVNGRVFQYGEKQKLLEEKAAAIYRIPHSQKNRISIPTLHAWIKVFKKSGGNLESLMPRQRCDKGHYRKLDGTLRMAIRELKKQDPCLTLPVMLTKLRHGRVLKAEDRINTASVYRFMKIEKLSEHAVPAVDRRKFEAEFPNEIWQCDVMHGPLVKVDGAKQRKSYLCAIIDDHSRLIVHAQFSTDETLESLKECMQEAMAKRGLPQKFYVDNGACYRAGNLGQVLALLGVHLVHSRPYTPQGRGKIERWFHTVRESFLPVWYAEGMALQALNERLECWVDEYKAREHSSTKHVPLERFRQNLACVRPAPASLRGYFRSIEHRLVRKDRTVHMGGKIYEVAVGLIDKKVELRFHASDPDSIEVFFDGRSFGQAIPVDLHLNKRVGRDMPKQASRDRKEAEVEAIPSGVLAGGQLFSPCRSDAEVP